MEIAAVTCYLGTGNDFIKQTLVVFPAFPELINQMTCMYSACIRKNHTRRTLLYLTQKKSSQNHLRVCTNVYIGIFSLLKPGWSFFHKNFRFWNSQRENIILDYCFWDREFYYWLLPIRWDYYFWGVNQVFKFRNFIQNLLVPWIWGIKKMNTA